MGSIVASESELCSILREHIASGKYYQGLLLRLPDSQVPYFEQVFLGGIQNNSNPESEKKSDFFLANLKGRPLKSKKKPINTEYKKRNREREREREMLVFRPNTMLIPRSLSSSSSRTESFARIKCNIDQYLKAGESK